MRLIFSTVLVGIGVALWFWGALRLAGRRRYLWKIHALGVSDVIGTLFILAGALLRSTENWPHVILAMGAVSFWGTAFSFVLARLGRNQGKERQQ
jgi:hypothetical protein